MDNVEPLECGKASLCEGEESLWEGIIKRHVWSELLNSCNFHLFYENNNYPFHLEDLLLPLRQSTEDWTEILSVNSICQTKVRNCSLEDSPSLSMLLRMHFISFCIGIRTLLRIYRKQSLRKGKCENELQCFIQCMYMCKLWPPPLPPLSHCVSL